VSGLSIDYSTQLHYLWALLPEVVLSIGAMVVLLVDVFQREDRGGPSSPLVFWLAVGFTLATAVANGWLLTVEEVVPTGMIAVDAFRVFANYLFLLAVVLFLMMSGRYLDEERLRSGELYALILFATVGMMVFAGARDLMVVFIGLELMSVPIYVLTGVNRRDPRAAEGALKYFLMGAFSSAFFLFGVALVYGGTGTTNIALIGLTLGPEGLGSNALVVLGVAMLAVGFGFKVAAVPFHMWTPDAYEGAPTPVTALMAAAVKAAAFAAFLRVFLTAFPGLYGVWDAIAIWLAVLTMIAANLVALVEGNVKRMLAYSSIAHAGYLLVALAAATVTGAASFLFYLVVYTLMTMGAFAVVMVVGRRGEAHLDLEDYAGLGWTRPLLGVVMTIFMLSLAGFPFTGGFIGKVYILQAAVGRGLVWLAVVLVMTSLISYYYYLRVAWYMWFRDGEAAAGEGIVVSTGTRVALIAAAGLVVLLGIFPGELLELAARSATSLFRQPGALAGPLGF